MQMPTICYSKEWGQQRQSHSNYEGNGQIGLRYKMMLQQVQQEKETSDLHLCVGRKTDCSEVKGQLEELSQHVLNMVLISVCFSTPS